MKRDLLRIQPVRFALLIAALIGAFVLGKCSTSEPPEEAMSELASCPEQTEQKEKQLVVDETFCFDDQCQDVRADTQCREPFLFLPGRRWGARIYGEPDDQEFPAPSFVVLKPVQKKQHIALPAALPEKVLLKPVRRKRRIAPLTFDKDIKFACTGSLLPAVLATVADLEAQSILYGIGPLSDCSGVLHRVLMGVKKRCPGHKYPSLLLNRDSRGIARWYHEQGKLIIIKNAVTQSDLIRPGMVLFFGRPGVRYKNPSLKTLLSLRHGIYHVGVVVRVYKDRKARVARYELFHGHGRRGRTKASVTKWHKRWPTRASYPPLGNGRQQLLAAAPIVGMSGL